jgi:hypothetical protein
VIAAPLHKLAAFVRAPEAHRANVRARLVTRSLAAGEEHLAHKRTSAALSAFGRALALDPENLQAKGRVERIRRRDRLKKVARATVIALAGVAVMIAAGIELRRAAQREEARAEAAQERAAREQAEAEQIAREKAQAEAQAKATPPPAQADPAAPPPATATTTPIPAPAPKKRTLPPPKPPEPLEVKLQTRYGADVSVDGRGLGYQISFPVKLLPGQHRVVVRHQCCEDATQVVSVNKNQPGQRYTLDYGQARPAQLEVVNAPPDARVVVDGVVLGTAAEPLPYGMSRFGPIKRVTVTIGERTLVETLKAGTVNRLDYAKATP